MRAGEINQLVRVERRSSAVDEAGQPVETWEPVDDIWAGIANETGMAAIRSGLQGSVPASIARYSFLVRFETVQALGIDAGMRLLHEGLVFEVKGVTRDLKNRDRAYIITEQGGNLG